MHFLLVIEFEPIFVVIYMVYIRPSRLNQNILLLVPMMKPLEPCILQRKRKFMQPRARIGFWPIVFETVVDNASSDPVEIGSALSLEVEVVVEEVALEGLGCQG